MPRVIIILSNKTPRSRICSNRHQCEWCATSLKILAVLCFISNSRYGTSNSRTSLGSRRTECRTISGAVTRQATLLGRTRKPLTTLVSTIGVHCSRLLVWMTGASPQRDRPSLAQQIREVEPRQPVENRRLGAEGCLRQEQALHAAKDTSITAAQLQTRMALNANRNRVERLLARLLLFISPLSVREWLRGVAGQVVAQARSARTDGRMRPTCDTRLTFRSRRRRC